MLMDIKSGEQICCPTKTKWQISLSLHALYSPSIQSRAAKIITPKKDLCALVNGLAAEKT